MSKVSYILGAGASYGSRKEPKVETFSSLSKVIIRGLPVLQDFSDALNQLLGELEGINDYNIAKKYITSNVLNELLKVSEEYPTIDTYAKMLYVTKRINEYEKFKVHLSLFFLIWQKNHKHDLRYDSFISSLIDIETCKFPPLTILSWNYDMQFEMSYSKYINEECALWEIWDKLNVYCKSNRTLKYNANDPFAFFKLNGSAMFHANEMKTDSLRSSLQDVLWSDISEETFWKKIYNLLENSQYKNFIPKYNNELSYAWENKGKEKLLSHIAQRVADCEILVVIGYSFPYVNREIDRHIFDSMPNLKCIYIQDKKSKVIEERINAIFEYLHKPTPTLVPKDDIDQFFLPNELG